MVWNDWAFCKLNTFIIYLWHLKILNTWQHKHIWRWVSKDVKFTTPIKLVSMYRIIKCRPDCSCSSFSVSIRLPLPRYLHILNFFASDLFFSGCMPEVVMFLLHPLVRSLDSTFYILQFGKEDQWCGHKLLTIHLDRNTLPLSHLVGCRFFEMLPKTKKKKKGIKLKWNIFFIYTYIPAVDFQSWKLGFILLINNLKEWGDAISAFSILSIGILQSFLFWNIICLYKP